jgi:hypothetical protein
MRISCANTNASKAFGSPSRYETVVEGRVNEKRVLRVEPQHYVINAADRNSAEQVKLLVFGKK